jgi:RNA polymerase sigma-70 factor (ECF subfamily)
MDGPSDEALVVALRDGDTASLGELVRRWERPLFRFVFRLLPSPDDAQEVCQETFLRILRRSDRFRDTGRFSTWMYQIALNLCRDRRRKRRRWSAVVVDGGLDSDRPPAGALGRTAEGAPDEVAARREIQRRVRRALRRIPAEQREVLVLKEFEGLRFREIAEIVGCPESTVKSRMYYGLRGLKNALEREEPESGSAPARAATERTP